MAPPPLHPPAAAAAATSAATASACCRIFFYPLTFLAFFALLRSFVARFRLRDIALIFAIICSPLCDATYPTSTTFTSSFVSLPLRSLSYNLLLTRPVRVSCYLASSGSSHLDKINYSQANSVPNLLCYCRCLRRQRCQRQLLSTLCACQFRLSNSNETLFLSMIR